MTRPRPSQPSRALLETEELFAGRRDLAAPITYWSIGPDIATAVPQDDEGMLAMVADDLLREVADAWTIEDEKGPIFELRRYEAAEDRSFDVVDPDGEPLATFLIEAGLVHDEVVVRDGTSAPLGEIVTDDGVHELRELHGSLLAESRRVLDRAGGDPTEQIWRLVIHPEGDRLFDRRVLVAAPLVCLLTSQAKRTWDPDSEVGVGLLIAFPPAGLLVLAVERTLDGLYWLRRKLN